MNQESECALDDRQVDIASRALADAIVVLATRGQIEDVEVAATNIAKALVAGLRVIQASCSTR